MKNLSAEQASELFATHPETNQFYITTDGQAFFTEENADSHGQRLKDRTVEVITRTDLTIAQTEPAVQTEPAAQTEPIKKGKAEKDNTTNA